MPNLHDSFLEEANRPPNEPPHQEGSEEQQRQYQYALACEETSAIKLLLEKLDGFEVDPIECEAIKAKNKPQKGLFGWYDRYFSTTVFKKVTPIISTSFRMKDNGDTKGKLVLNLSFPEDSEITKAVYGPKNHNGYRDCTHQGTGKFETRTRNLSQELFSFSYYPVPDRFCEKGGFRYVSQGFPTSRASIQPSFLDNRSTHIPMKRIVKGNFEFPFFPEAGSYITLSEEEVAHLILMCVGAVAKTKQTQMQPILDIVQRKLDAPEELAPGM